MKLCAIVDPVEYLIPTWRSLVPGMMLDRYELISPIGEGGMGQVWVARQSGKYGFQKLVAVKTILPRFALDERSHAMFVDEVRVASRVEHANVAQILDVGEQEDITYLVMEYVDGEALSVVRDTLRRRRLSVPPGVLLRIASDVCAGLHAAHDLRDGDGQLLGVVHRDVSPQNILVSINGEAKLIDFGLAKARGRMSGDTSEGTLKGKIRYMAPEQACGRPVDRRTDVWSIGAVLHDALTGRPLYAGENDTQILHCMANSEPVLSLPPSVHPAIAAVVRRALVADPEGRFATTAEMQQAIEGAMVEAKITVTSQTVTEFLLEHVGSRVLARREFIRRGLQEASRRADARSISEMECTGETEITNVLPANDKGSPAGEAPPGKAPLDESRCAEALPFDESRRAEAPFDESRSAEAPFDESRSAEAPLDESRSAEAPLDESRSAEAPLDESRSAEAPLADIPDRFAMSASNGSMATTALGIALAATALFTFVSMRSAQPVVGSSPAPSMLAAEVRTKPRALLERLPGLPVSPYVVPGLRADAPASSDGTQPETPKIERLQASPSARVPRTQPTSSKRRVGPRAMIDDGF